MRDYGLWDKAHCKGRREKGQVTKGYQKGVYE